MKTLHIGLTFSRLSIEAKNGRRRYWMYNSNENQITRAYRSRDSKWLITFIILGVLNHIPTLKTRMDINSFSSLFLSPPRKCNKSSLHINAFVTNSTGEQMKNINYNRDFAFSCTHVPTFLRGCRDFSRLACERAILVEGILRRTSAGVVGNVANCDSGCQLSQAPQP